jgi:hypothetical protein
VVLDRGGEWERRRPSSGAGAAVGFLLVGIPALGFDQAIDLVCGRAQWSSSWRRRCALTR